jgi:predicted nucleotidyltransferase
MKRCRDEKGIDSAILYGSYARKTENPNSDVDVTIIINNKFEINQLIKKINHSLN